MLSEVFENSLSILLKEKTKERIEEKMKEMNLRKQRGITILALTITIIILLILAGITIAGLTGENGLIENAGQAKEETEISNEKEILERATATTMGKDKRGNIEEENLEKELEEYNVDVTQLGNNFICKFPSNREYIVNQDGELTEKKGLLANEITSDCYGNYVMNYSDIDVADGGENQKSDWQIYYAGKVADEAEEHIYLISSNYISIESIPASKNNYIVNKGNYPYAVNFANILNDYSNGSDDVTEETRYLNKQYYDYLKYNNKNSKNTNIKVVAYMCDTSVWNKFKTNKADFAIGGPTIELLFKSYNEKYGTNYLAGSLEMNETSKDSNGDPIPSITEIGYRISDNGGENWATGYNFSIIEGDKTYILGSKNTAGIWLASPSATTQFVMMINSNRQVTSDGIFGVNKGFRPIVRLKSDVQLEKVEYGYRIVE